MPLLAGLTFGLLGSLHCAGMCGPLALALPAPPASAALYYMGRVLYNAGRAVTYALLGSLMGAVGGLFAVAGWQQALSIGAGIVLLIGVFVPVLFRRLPGGIAPGRKVTSAVQAALSRLMRRRSVPVLFVIGLLNGFLPCGFVYVALAAAATTGGPLPGALFMGGFGLGTIPIMFAVSLAGRRVGGALRRRVAALAPAFAVVLAIIIILRGLDLGIPFISPALPVPDAGAETRCH